MKNWKQNALIGMVAIIALGFGFIGCDDKGDDGKEKTEKQTPVVDDFNISGIGAFDYDGRERTVTISPKQNKSTGAITVYYNGSVTAPISANIYSITFDVAEAKGFYSVNGLSAGDLTIKFSIGGVSFIFECNKDDIISWAKLEPVVQTYLRAVQDPESTHAEAIQNLSERTDAKYRIIVDYSDEGKSIGFTATDGQTLTIGSYYIANTPLTVAILRNGFRAMYAEPWPIGTD
jgi:hypothetical protein